MRHLKYLFTVPEGEKVTEKHLRRVLVSSVCSMLLCMYCLISTTWAWFAVTVTSENNVIQMGNFAPVVTVTDSQGETVTPDTPDTYRLSSGTYEVNIVNEGDVKGFCKVFIGTGEYHVTLGVDSDQSPISNSFTFEVTVPDETVSMYVSGCWGTPAQSDNETLSGGLSVTPVNTPSGDDETVSSEPTQGSTTETGSSTDSTQETVISTESQPAEETQAGEPDSTNETQSSAAEATGDTTE